MKRIICVTLMLTNIATFACAILQKGENGNRSHPAIKHFVEEKDENRQIVLKNITDEDCTFTIAKTELIQARDGSYSYLPYKIGQTTKRSLNPYISLLDDKGSESFNIIQSLAPNETKSYAVQINIPKAENLGSYHSGFQIDFTNKQTSFMLGEIYYSTKNTSVSPQLRYLKFLKDKKKLAFAVTNKGDAYTFFTMNLVYTDPITGFESKGVLDEDDMFLYKANLNNYLLPNGRTILGEVSLKYHIKNLRRQFNEQFPGQLFPEVLNLTAIPLYGIDYENWENHKNIPLGLKSIMIQTN
ncbi:hypothetical protein [Halobacteriovorax sp.]|uniref:hypothetical protein n=1 Tax=Halobacteriovorax sp. TaxID=2020862 RepID=UPI003AF1E548